MKTRVSRVGVISILACAAVLFSTAASAEPTVSNVWATQLQDQTVEILYNLTGVTGSGAVISVAFSEDGGATYAVAPSPAALSGDIGALASGGNELHIVWTASVDMPPNYYNTTFRAAVTAVAGGSGEITFSLPGDVPLTLVWIEPGSYQMGANPGETGADDREYPQHTVTFTEGFYMGKYEVTQGQWEAIMGSNPAHDHGVGPDYPVYYVSWDDIAEPGGDAFIDRLNQHLVNTGQVGWERMRLPSEAEWEYACRAGTTTRFSHGDAEDPPCGEACDFCVLHDTYMVYCGNDNSQCEPVDSKQPNPWGLCDMHGNVFEWVQDWYHESYDGAPPDGSAWEDPTGSGWARVTRGGNWSSWAESCRSACRRRDDPSTGWSSIGFRLAMSPAAESNALTGRGRSHTAESNIFTLDLRGAAIPGDCNQDGSVSIGEVQGAINMFLGTTPIACGVDQNEDGTVSIGEVQSVINAFLGA